MRAHMHACVHTFLSACHTHSQCLRANDRAPTPCTTPKYLAANAHTLPRNLPPYRPPNTKKKNVYLELAHLRFLLLISTQGKLFLLANDLLSYLLPQPPRYSL